MFKWISRLLTVPEKNTWPPMGAPLSSTQSRREMSHEEEVDDYLIFLDVERLALAKRIAKLEAAN